MQGLFFLSLCKESSDSGLIHLNATGLSCNVSVGQLGLFFFHSLSKITFLKAF